MEWAERHAAELRDKAVAYVNSDSNGPGYLSMGGSHTLPCFMNQVARDVKDPKRGVSAAERRRAQAMVAGNREARRRALTRGEGLPDAPGSGTTSTPPASTPGTA